MSDTLIAKEIRRRCKAALATASITAEGDPVAALKTLPAGWVVPEDHLPAFYVFTSGEALDHISSVDEVERTLFLDIVLMAKASGDPMDALDDMQLGVERTMIDAAGFGLARSNRLMSVEIAQNQGAIVIGARVLKFEIVFGATPDDPSF